MNYDESVAYMSGLLAFGIRLGRERFVALLARLGNPHDRLRCLHVAGTNGKGSTTTFLASVLRAGGYRVGAYFSPYVFDLRERIQIDETMIPRDDFARWVTTIRPHIDALAETELGQTTEFELKTAVAFCYFAEQQVDFAVIEVGIGGRLDATNVIGPPLAGVITTIGMDHVKILGDTPAKIAAEKAGIVKPGMGCLATAVPPGPALDVIAAKAAECGVPLVHASDHALSRSLKLTLRGPFQVVNAATAAAAITYLTDHGLLKLPPDALRTGLETASLPGRFQVVDDGRDGGPALVLDVAHNEDGARVLAEALRATFPNQELVFVVGMRKNHEPEPFLRELAAQITRLVPTAPPFRPLPADELAEVARRMELNVSPVVEPASDAIVSTWKAALPGQVVVVTGSFYTVGETPPPLRGVWRGV